VTSGAPAGSTDEGVLLLAEAVCAPPEQARSAWHRWRASVDLDLVGPRSFALLPAAARRVAVVRDDPDLGRLRGVYRRCWVANQLVLEAARPVLASLATYGVRYAQVGTAGLLVALDDPGVRPLTLVDIVATADSSLRLDVALADGGWTYGADGRVHDDRGHPCPVLVSVGLVPGSWARAADNTVVGPGDPLPAADLLLHLLAGEHAATARAPRSTAAGTSSDQVGRAVDAHLLAARPGVPTGLAAAARRHGVLEQCRAEIDLLLGMLDAPGLRAVRRALATARPGWVEGLRRVSLSGRAGRGLKLLASHGAGGSGPLRATAALVEDRLDLRLMSHPTWLLVHATLGRPAMTRRLGDRLGGWSTPRLALGPLAAGDIVQMNQPATVLQVIGPGWARCGPAGVPSHGPEAWLRLRLPPAGAFALVLRLAADQRHPVEISCAGRTVRSPGVGGPATVRLVVPGGDIEVLLRPGAGRARQRCLLVVLESISVQPTGVHEPSEADS
jgi:hypothetical protein